MMNNSVQIHSIVRNNQRDQEEIKMKVNKKVTEKRKRNKKSLLKKMKTLLTWINSCYDLPKITVN
jgi:hypothetical protein